MPRTLNRMTALRIRRTARSSGYLLNNGPVPGGRILHNPVAPFKNRAYPEYMSKVKDFEFEKQDTLLDDEDEEMLAAIDEGIRDADAGRTVPAEEVRDLLPQWTTASSTLKKR